MATFSTTASGNDMLAHGTASWTRGTARQGCYGTNIYYGAIIFTGLSSFPLADKQVSRIQFSFTHGAAGPSASKTMYLYAATQKTISGTPSAMRGVYLGTLGPAVMYSNTSAHTLDVQSNAALFQAVLSHLQGGGNGFCLYRSESAMSGQQYSANYLNVESATLTLTYEDAFVWYNHNGTWIKCAVYYSNAGAWQRCQPYYKHDGSWVKV